MNDKNNNILLEQALAYRKMGWPIFPISKNKKPLILWPIDKLAYLW